MSEENSVWIKKDLWSRRSKNFNVEVSRHTVPASSYNPHEGTNRWAVYAYIFPEHRLFARFEGTDMSQEAACSLPLHCGPSYLRVHRNDAGEIASYQVGADYHHLYDDRFADFSTERDAYEVFNDAAELFAHLED